MQSEILDLQNPENAEHAKPCEPPVLEHETTQIRFPNKPSGA